MAIQAGSPPSCTGSTHRWTGWGCTRFSRWFLPRLPCSRSALPETVCSSIAGTGLPGARPGDSAMRGALRMCGEERSVRDREWMTWNADATAIQAAVEECDSAAHRPAVAGHPGRIPDQAPPAAGARLLDTRDRLNLAAVHAVGVRPVVRSG